MKYILILFGTFAAGLLLYFGALLALTPALVPAEYWVRGTLLVKRGIATRYRDQRKIIIGSGSSGLFGVDTTALTKDLGVPVLNMALHGGLPLDTILTEAGYPASPGDAVVLLLEPFYYSRPDPINWQIRNMIAWDPARWRTLSLAMRVRYLSRLEPSFVLDVVGARVQQVFEPDALSARRACFDDETILAEFAAATPPTSFEYSPSHLDPLGNMQHAIGHLTINSVGTNPDTPTEIGPAQRATLVSFVQRMRDRGVKVYFGNAPVYSSRHRPFDWAAVDRASQSFARAMADIGPVIDERRQVVFDEELFFNTDFHLNEEGRKLRTAALLRALRRSVVPSLSDRVRASSR